MADIEISYRLSRSWRFFIAWTVFFVVLYYSASQSEDANFLRSLNAWGAPLYSDRFQNEIVVVMADPVSLGELGYQWPLRYDAQADIIAKIMEQKPRILALDLLFTDPREGTDFLWDTLSEYEKKIPIFGAAVPAGISDLKIVTNDDNKPLPFIQADITADSDWADMGYKLRAQPSGSDGPPESLAFAMYRKLCESRKPEDKLRHEACPAGPIEPADYTREMLVFWGSGSPDYNTVFDNKLDIADKLFQCSSAVPPLQRLWNFLLGKEAVPAGNCAYHPVLPIDLLMGLGDEELKAALEGKIVLYGVDHPGIPDIVDPPTSQPLPGVHLHAMALDNLLTYRAKYFGTSNAPVLGLDSLSFTALRFLVAVAIFLSFLPFLLSNRKQEHSLEVEISLVKIVPIRSLADIPHAFFQARKSIIADIVEATDAWIDKRPVWLSSHEPDRNPAPAYLILLDLLWLAGLIPDLMQRSKMGRVVFLALVAIAVACLDLFVFLVPMTTFLVAVSIFGASQLMAPVGILKPARKGKGAADDPAHETTPQD